MPNETKQNIFTQGWKTMIGVCMGRGEEQMNLPGEGIPQFCS